MQSKPSDWYKHCWTLDIQNQSWTETTVPQVDFLTEKLNLSGNERILDLACGFGRHALEFARRGYNVTGVDITPAYIDYAQKTALTENLPAQFICSDLRSVSFAEEFDVVLNMADGAIGYLENDAENEKIFDLAARSLKPGGKHFMDIMNAEYADSHFPCRLWEAGANGLTLSAFEWNPQTRILLYGQLDYPYGTVLPKPEFPAGDPIRLYTPEEIRGIMTHRGMAVRNTWSDFSGAPASPNAIQLMVLSGKL